MTFKTCSDCNALITNNLCPYCKKDGISLDITPSTITIPLKKKDIEKDDWVGPLDMACVYCKEKQIYFMITPPPSPDEPPIITHKCFNCNKRKVTYKH